MSVVLQTWPCVVLWVMISFSAQLAINIREEPYPYALSARGYNWGGWLLGETGRLLVHGCHNAYVRTQDAIVVPCCAVLCRAGTRKLKGRICLMRGPQAGTPILTRHTGHHPYFSTTLPLSHHTCTMSHYYLTYMYKSHQTWHPSLVTARY